MAIIPDCVDFLNNNATGKWFETYTMKNKETNDFIHPITKETTLLRVELKQKRAFYWLLNANDAIRFSEYIGLTLKGEAHEIFTRRNCRFFYDIDLVLDEIEKHEIAHRYGFMIDPSNEMEVMNEVGKRLSYVLKEATLISMEEHGIDSNELKGFDWLFTMRNRQLPGDSFKISIHLITNLFIPLRGCAAIAAHVKGDVLLSNTTVLNINEDIANMLLEAIDDTQYRFRGSLSLPYGTKISNAREYSNWIYKQYDVPNQRYLLTLVDRFSLVDINLANYNISQDVQLLPEANPDFVEEALTHVSKIPDYDPRVWDIKNSILRRSTMFVKRYASSYCSVCERTHDNDNTLFLIFNSDWGTAAWKCIRSPGMKPIVFFKTAPKDESHQQIDDVDVESFESKFAAPKSKPRELAAISSRQKPIDVSEDNVDAFAKIYATPRFHTDSNKDKIDDPYDKFIQPRKQKTPNPKIASEHYTNDSTHLPCSEYNSDDEVKPQEKKVFRYADKR